MAHETLVHLKHSVRKVGTRWAPRLTAAWLGARSRAHSHRLIEQWGIAGLNHKLVQHLGMTVSAGPFEGTILPQAALREHLGPFLLGVYESELHPWIDELSSRAFSQVLDVGAKFGYYAVGLARLMPKTHVVAFDTDWWARSATRKMVEENGVLSSVQVQGFCSPQWLAKHLRPDAFVFSDCEGYEATLFLGPDIDALRSATLLIESHEQLVPDITARLRERFARTHHIRSVKSTSERRKLELPFLSAEEQALVVTEFRGREEWLLLEPFDRS